MNTREGHLWLVQVLLHNRLTFEEISYKWQRLDQENEPLSRRTFHRWRESIAKEFGVEIECDKHNGYVYHVTKESIESLSEMNSWLLRSLSLSSTLSASKDLSDRILLEDVPSASVDKYGDGNLTKLMEAMRANHVVEFDYTSYYKSEKTHRIFHPYCLKMYKQRWYVFGYSVGSENKEKEDDGRRTFSLDCMENLIEKDECFMIPKDFDAKEYYRNFIGIITGDGSKPETIQLKVSKIRSPYIGNLPLHHSQKLVEKCTDGSCIFEYYLCPTNDFVQQILFHGSEIEILKPQSLRERMKRRLETMLESYKLG